METLGQDRQRTGDRIEDRGQDRGWGSDLETCRHGQRTGDRTEDGGQTLRHVDIMTCRHNDRVTE